ncbi:MAG: hypothetical protein ACYTG0_04920 [Planctomycetota bacterium]|jgi:hypothetical protein
MSRLSLGLLFLAVAVFTLGLSGCGNGEDTAPDPSPESGDPEAASSVTHPHEGESGPEPGEGEKESEYAEALAKLSEADQKLAAKQKICPVSGAPLGSMDTPVKVAVTVDGEDREVLLCCAHCEDAIKSDPKKWLAKLDE